MGEELGWSYSQRRKQVADGVKFLGSMGLPPALLLSSNLLEPIPRTLFERIERSFWRTGQNVLGVVYWGSNLQKADEMRSFSPSRYTFETGEIVALRNTFNSRTKVSEGVEKVAVEDILNILKEIPGYAGVTKKELDYVLEETGLQEGTVNFDDFIEVRSSSPSAVIDH